jgi:hypothetical protein
MHRGKESRRGLRTQRSGKSSIWHLLGPEFDSSASEYSVLRLKKIPLVVPHPLLGYVSCSPPSGWAIAEWTVVADPLVMEGQGSGIFSTETSGFMTS